MRILSFHSAAVAICAGVLIASMLSTPARSEDDCRDIERSYDIARADITTVQTNSALFAAADRGCEALARRLLAAGASLEARDRFGAMPLAHAARACQLRLTKLLLAQGAAIDARNLAGSTA
ncbi:MAG: ankyrin repeat domain-containing protein, partial [Bradyrhizobium sp.]